MIFSGYFLRERQISGFGWDIRSGVFVAESVATSRYARGARDGPEDDGTGEDAFATSERQWRKGDVARAISSFVVPDGYTKLEAPPKHANRSALWVYGVKAKAEKRGKPVHVFFCLASDSCRSSKTMISVGPTSTTNALNHLRQKHGVERCVVQDRREGQVETRTLKTNLSPPSVAMRSFHARKMVLSWIEAHIIRQLCPLSFGEDGKLHACWNVIYREDFPTLALDRTNVKNRIVEMYAATTSKLKQYVVENVAKDQLLHLSLEVWTDKFSSLKFMGVRVWYVDPSWNLKSHLLAVRQFNPAAHVLQQKRLSTLLHEYLNGVFSEFGISESMLVSSITEAGSDVMRLGDDLLPSMWEWCIPHMLNCALAEGFGLSHDTSKSKNAEARKVLVAVKETVEHVHQSPMAKDGLQKVFSKRHVNHCDRCLKLVDIAPQRWIGLTLVLEKVLVNWEHITTVTEEDLGRSPIASLKTEIHELYSLLKPVSLLISRCRSTSKPTGAEALLLLAELKLTALDDSADLDVLTPLRRARQGAESQEAWDGGGIVEEGVEEGKGEDSDGVESTVVRPHAKLTLAAQVTRRALQRAMAWRWFSPRYDPDSGDTVHLFDLQTMCHPATARLMHLGALAGDLAESARLSITTRFLETAAGLADVADKAGEASSAATTDACSTPRAKRHKGFSDGELEKMFSRAGTKADVAKSERLAKLGLFSPKSSDGPASPTNAEKARDELDEFINIPGVTPATCPLSEVLNFWKTYGESRFPLLARAARKVLGAPASAAVLERDLGSVGSLLDANDSLADAPWVEMVLFLNANIDLMPKDIPALSDEAVQWAVPKRLRQPNPELKSLMSPSGNMSFEQMRAVMEQPSIV